jgi:NitT/TauT family transport system substrate-binding protein
MMIKQLCKQWLAALALGLAAQAAGAQAVKLNVGFVPAGDWLPALVAKDKGFFDKRGLDVTLTKVALISNVPPAIMSGSLTIGPATPPVLIDTAEAGLGLSALAGGTRFVKDPAIFSLVARNGVTVKTAKDLEGKRVGVPGVRSVADMMFRKWLMQNNVNPSAVNIVETSFPQMKDLLKGGTVDAVAVLEPFRARIVADGTGYRVNDYVAEVNPDVLGSVWIAKNEWLAANPKAVQGFREALAEAIAFIKSHNEEARAIETKYLGFNAPFVLPFTTSASAADLDVHVRMAREVGYLGKPVDTSKLVLR